MRSVPQNVIKHKVGLLNLAAELGNVSRACKVMGFSRDTFYRYQTALEAGGVDALIDANRRKPNLRNRVEEATEVAVAQFAIEQPAFGQVRVSNCNDPAKPAHFMRLTQMLQPGSSYQAPGAAAGCCKSQSSHQ